LVQFPDLGVADMAKAKLVPMIDPNVLEMCDMIGNIIESWGFRKVLGKIWTLLYLNPEPLSASEIRDLLAMSTGNVSMALQELERWGIIKRTHGAISRRDYFESETHLWKMISRVFRERERVYIENAHETMQKIVWSLKHAKQTGRIDQQLNEFRRLRIEQLMHASQIALRLLDALIATARIDASPLRNFQLVKELAFGRGRKS
jgi:DNA-binding transcriptional regulator GbsR (MarR family)